MSLNPFGMSAEQEAKAPALVDAYNQVMRGKAQKSAPTLYYVEKSNDGTPSRVNRSLSAEQPKPMSYTDALKTALHGEQTPAELKQSATFVEELRKVSGRFLWQSGRWG